MPKKRFSAEQIVVLLRQIEVLTSQGKATPVDRLKFPVLRRHFPVNFSRDFGSNAVKDIRFQYQNSISKRPPQKFPANFPVSREF